MKLRKNALQRIEFAIIRRLDDAMTAFNKADNEKVVELMQRGLLTYEDLVEPSKLSLEDTFWSYITDSEKERHPQDIEKVLKLMQAGKMAAAMDEVANLKELYIADTTAHRIYSLIEDYMNNKEEFV